MLCSCQSSGKKIVIQFNPRFLSDLSGERYDLEKKEDLRFVYLYGCFIFRLSRAERFGEGARKRKDKRIDITIAAIMAERIHLFPFRTQKLSFLTPKVLCGTPLGRIGHRRFSVFIRSL